MPDHSPENLTLATTGASGSLFIKHLLIAVECDDRVRNVNFIASDSGLRVLAEELGLTGRNNLITQLIGQSSVKIHQQQNSDIGANVASGSYPSDAMVILPCSVGTLARIANGDASHLIERAADVTLKERRRLVLMVRETPLTLTHLRNMATVTENGGVIAPPVPAFYTRPAGLEDMVDHTVGRVLDLFGIDAGASPRWGELVPSVASRNGHRRLAATGSMS